MTTETEGEKSPREIAEMIAHHRFNFINDPVPQIKGLIRDIEKAIRAERDRAARIIKDHRESDRCEGSCWEIITSAIRGTNK